MIPERSRRTARLDATGTGQDGYHQAQVDFQQVTVVTGKQVDAVIQPTQKTKLNADTLDWSQPHYPAQ